MNIRLCPPKDAAHVTLAGGLVAHVEPMAGQRWRITSGPDCSTITAWWVLPDTWIGQPGLMRGLDVVSQWDGIDDPPVAWSRAWKRGGPVRRREDPRDPDTEFELRKMRVLLSDAGPVGTGRMVRPAQPSIDWDAEPDDGEDVVEFVMR